MARAAAANAQKRRAALRRRTGPATGWWSTTTCSPTACACQRRPRVGRERPSTPLLGGRARSASPVSVRGRAALWPHLPPRPARPPGLSPQHPLLSRITRTRPNRLSVSLRAGREKGGAGWMSLCVHPSSLDKHDTDEVTEHTSTCPAAEDGLRRSTPTTRSTHSRLGHALRHLLARVTYPPPPVPASSRDLSRPRSGRRDSGCSAKCSPTITMHHDGRADRRRISWTASSPRSWGEGFATSRSARPHYLLNQLAPRSPTSTSGLAVTDVILNEPRSRAR